LKALIKSYERNQKKKIKQKKNKGSRPSGLTGLSSPRESAHNGIIFPSLPSIFFGPNFSFWPMWPNHPTQL
jgi:hypothetical protein